RAPRPRRAPPARRRRGRLAGHVVRALLGKRLVRRQAAVARARQGRVRAAPAVGENRRATARDGLFLVAALGLFGGELGLGAYVDPPPGQACSEPRVEALATDRERQLVVRHDDGRLLGLVVHEDLAHARRRQRL